MPAAIATAPMSRRNAPDSASTANVVSASGRRCAMVSDQV
jgi:hypothetical protein